MKVTPEDVQTIAEAIKPHDTEERREAYRKGEFPRSEAVKDLDKRYCWDLFWQAFNEPNMDVRAILVRGEYNDSHIYTALRSIVKPL